MDQNFTRSVLSWYDAGHRDLPWRRTKDAYRIWVSEIMLQQTRAETVVSYYERFLARYPDVRALADAPEEELLKAWEGLGYYSRARLLQKAARAIVSQYGGELPADLFLDGMRKLNAVVLRFQLRQLFGMSERIEGQRVVQFALFCSESEVQPVVQSCQ